jgi:hypothetical protein
MKHTNTLGAQPSVPSLHLFFNLWNWSQRSFHVLFDPSPECAVQMTGLGTLQITETSLVGKTAKGGVHVRSRTCTTNGAWLLVSCSVVTFFDPAQTGSEGGPCYLIS